MRKWFTLLLILVSLSGEESSGRAAPQAPYPASRIITRLSWDANVVKLKAGAGDNWPITWVDDELN